MQWMELSLHTTHEAIDWVRTLLATVDFAGKIGIAECSPSDLSASQRSQPDSAWAFTVRLALPYHSQTMTQAEAIHRLLSPLERTGLTTALEIEILDQQPSYPSAGIYQIGQRFVVLPPDHPHQATSNQILLRLEPSLSFGSGLHPATVLSLQLLEQYLMPAMTTLDLGCGSGILSLAMARLGATVLALDNDPIAVQSAQRTVQLNAAESHITVKQGSLGSGCDLGHWMGGTICDAVPSLNLSNGFDLIASNILARIHMTLAADYRQALRVSETGSGILITAGFTTDQAADVGMALTEAGFVETDCKRLGEWVALVYRVGS